MKELNLSIQSTYSLIILRALLDGQVRPIKDIVKLISKLKGVRLPISNVKRSYVRLCEQNCIEYCEGPDLRCHYIKITEEGKKRFFELERTFRDNYTFFTRVYNEVVINK